MARAARRHRARRRGCRAGPGDRPDPAAAYPGLRSFAPDDTGLFFGRDRQIDGLIERLSRANIMVVLGGSGCGKSSLVRAGLIPRLFAGDVVPGRPGRWYVLELRPGEDPNAALLAAIADQLVAPILRITDAADPPDGPTFGQRALAQAFGLEPAGDGDALRESCCARSRRSCSPAAPTGTCGLSGSTSRPCSRWPARRWTGWTRRCRAACAPAPPTC